ncbi:Guanine nucleotide exchange factor [Dirofilaria immitis]
MADSNIEQDYMLEIIQRIGGTEDSTFWGNYWSFQRGAFSLNVVIMSVNGTTALKSLNNIYNSIHNFIALAEKGNGSDIALKLRYVEASLEQFKESIDSASDIIGNENHQPHNNDLNLSANNRNALPLHCIQCNCAILSPNVASFVDAKPFSLPFCRQAKNNTSISAEVINSWWQVERMFDFENIGFTHARDGVKYLVCANCEDGPVGYLCPVTKAHFVAVCRVKQE